MDVGILLGNVKCKNCGEDNTMRAYPEKNFRRRSHRVIRCIECGEPLIELYGWRK